jgi:hypothetical protein
MQTSEQAHWREDFTDTRKSVESWRASRQRGARIPEPLWEAALALAERHGVAKTASTLKLDYYVLKRRLALDSVSANSNVDDVDAPPRFVEVSLPSTHTTAGITCTLEIEGRGDRLSKLRLELQGIALADLDALLRSVWS